ncbi:MAG: MotA/TolQ/ExbB proton channel family protein [Bacteroidales bacterium]|nr:MotA/TolQ/ExbB proton channel family protein [Bacteroidales bacterium]
MHYITDTLYWISTGLLVPVVLLLIYFFLRALVLIGGWFGQYLDTRRLQASLGPKVDNLRPDGMADLQASLPKSRLPLAATLGQVLAEENPARIEKLLADFEVEAEASMALPKTLAKMGPMLGLMGTLIPMGPALVGLSTGDIASMAYNMQVAFATTVIGLFSAAIGFVVLQSRQRWHARDLNILEYVAALKTQNTPAA